jgi:hypothetical protein
MAYVNALAKIQSLAQQAYIFDGITYLTVLSLQPITIIGRSSVTCYLLWFLHLRYSAGYSICCTLYGART